jgi:hypothetical protein
VRFSKLAHCRFDLLYNRHHLLVACSQVIVGGPLLTQSRLDLINGSRLQSAQFVHRSLYIALDALENNLLLFCHFRREPFDGLGDFHDVLADRHLDTYIHVAEMFSSSE